MIPYLADALVGAVVVVSDLHLIAGTPYVKKPSVGAYNLKWKSYFY